MTPRLSLPIAAAATVAAVAPAPGPSIREQIAEAHLSRIVAAEGWFFTMNECGTQAEFQAAADAFHDAIDSARQYLDH